MRRIIALFLNVVVWIFEYLKKQSLTDYGTFLLGMTALIAVVKTDDLLNKIIEVRSFIENTRDITLEVKQISIETKKILAALEESLKKEKAKEIAGKNVTKNKIESDSELKEILNSLKELPDFPDAKDTSLQYFIPAKDKKALITEIASMTDKDEIMKEVASKLQVFNANGPIPYSAYFYADFDKVKVIAQNSPMGKVWVQSVARKEDLVTLNLIYDFPKSEFKCFCVKSPDADLCSVRQIDGKKIVLKTFSGAKYYFDFHCELKSEENEYL